jgi:hypothetical protein
MFLAGQFDPPWWANSLGAVGVVAVAIMVLWLGRRLVLAKDADRRYDEMVEVKNATIDDLRKQLAESIADRNAWRATSETLSDALASLEKTTSELSGSGQLSLKLMDAFLQLAGQR